MITKGTTASVGALVSDEPTADLDELAAWAREYAGEVIGRQVYPADLQRLYRLTWNAACSALEALEARGDLERVPGPALAWRPARQGPRLGKTPSGGYALPLSPKEHGALLRLLDQTLHEVGALNLWTPTTGPGAQIDVRLLRAIRSRLKRPSNQ